MPVEGRATDVLAVRLEKAEQIDDVDRALRAHPGVKESVLLSGRGILAFWHVVSAEEGGIIGVIARHGGFPYDLVRVNHGIEQWTVGLSNREKAHAILADLKLKGEPRIVSLKAGGFPDFALTEAQARVLQAAISGGYYEFPRRTSPTKLARKLGIAKSTLLEHLQRAEAKIIISSEWLLH